MTGDLTDTYVAALQHDLVDLEGHRLVGVVRTPTPWFHGAVDENRPELGPPADLLAEVDARQETLARRGLCDGEAHNAAWSETDFASRYRDHLAEDDAARAAMGDLREALRTGQATALVCYENTDEKRCHRTILREVLAEGLEDA